METYIALPGTTVLAACRGLCEFAAVHGVSQMLYNDRWIVANPTSDPAILVDWYEAVEPRELVDMTEPELTEFQNTSAAMLMEYMLNVTGTNQRGYAILLFDEHGMVHVGTNLDQDTMIEACRRMADGFQKDHVKR